MFKLSDTFQFLLPVVSPFDGNLNLWSQSSSFVILSKIYFKQAIEVIVIRYWLKKVILIVNTCREITVTKRYLTFHSCKTFPEIEREHKKMVGKVVVDKDCSSKMKNCLRSRDSVNRSYQGLRNLCHIHPVCTRHRPGTKPFVDLFVFIISDEILYRFFYRFLS